MDWQAEYRRKMVSPAEAVSVVKSGDRVVVPLGQRPETLLSALAARKGELQNVEIVACAPYEASGWEWFDPAWQESFGVKLELFAGSFARPALDAHFVDYIPILFSIQFKLMEERKEEAKNVDVCIVIVSPPDKNGYCSFGGQLWTKKSYARRARKVIAEVAPNLIRMGGDSHIHVSQVDYFVETAPTRSAVATLNAEDHTRRIAEHLSTLVKDGDTIQVGIGSVTNCLVQLGAFDNVSDLGAHTELTVPGYTKLVRQGIITGKYKTIDTYKHVATAWSGDEEDLAFMDGNPTFEAREPEYVINIKTISAHDNMLAVNNAICVDLTGSICSESIGTRVYNGTGGQTEFHIGAMLSKGGRAVTVLPSTALDGTVSRIVPCIQDGSYVTIPRALTDIIVTEYGIAKLLGKSQRERAEALINIAHPDFRGELREAAKRLFWP